MADKTPRDEKTEEPTKKRLEDSKKEGQVVRGKELTGVLMIIGMVWAGGVLSRGNWAVRLKELVVAPLRDPRTWATENLANLTLESIPEAFYLIFTPLLLGFLIAFVVLMAQGAPVFTVKPFEFKPSKFNGMKKLQKILKPKYTVGMIAWGHFKVLLVFGATALGLWAMVTPITLSGQIAIADLPEYMVAMLGPGVKGMLGAGTLLAIGDFIYKKWDQKGEIKMSKKEIRDEHKSQEGDPLVKARIRAIQREQARRKMISDIEGATVVVTNPTHYSVALRYMPGKDAVPTVVAKGRGYLALKIREKAKEWGVPIVESPPLARRLHAEVGVGSEIAEDHFGAVATILIQVLSAAESEAQ